MAETQTAEETQSEEQTDGGNGSPGQHDTRNAAVRAAAIAAATGATALAAKRALSNRGSKSDDEGEEGADQKPARKNGGKAGDPSMLTSVLSSSWESARHAIVPMLEDAATSAGEYVGQNAPDLVTDTLVPQFIRGFERGQKNDKSSSSSSSDENDEE